VIKGLIWYEKNKHNLTNGETKFEYTGLAEMTYEGRNGKLSSRRLKRDGEKRALFEVSYLLPLLFEKVKLIRE